MTKQELPDTHLYLESLLPIVANIRKKKRTSKKEIMKTIIELCSERELSATELSVLLLRTKGSLQTHYIGFMCDNGLLQRKYPGYQVQPKQKFTADRSVIKTSKFLTPDE
ncbi:MAG: hypothetical protein PHS31_01625 [Victivallaceae bacterium]|nr:hypothetical protein [Victivallaceae bacterium]MDD4180397.1 hypothetical protein [Victivallaceae bacterium]